MVVDLCSLFKGFRHPRSLRTLLLSSVIWLASVIRLSPKTHVCQGVLLSVCRASAVPDTSYNKFTVKTVTLDTLV